MSLVLLRKALPYLAALAIVLGSLWLAYDHGRNTMDAEWQATWNDHVADDAKATAQYQAEQRAIEASRIQTITKVTQDAQQAIDSAYADAADAARATDSVQQAADRLATRLADSQARVSACTTAASKAAAEHARVLADVFKRADTRAGHLAGVADQARVRGLACEAAYDAIHREVR